MPDSPDWALTLAANYRIPIDSQPFDGFVNGSLYWRDEVLFSTANDPLLVGDDYASVDLAVGIAAENGGYRAQLFVQNLFDEFYTVSMEEQSVVGIRAAHGMAYDYTRRFGVALQVDF
jgi:iron complex outermembrane receptor protein